MAGRAGIVSSADVSAATEEGLWAERGAESAAGEASTIFVAIGEGAAGAASGGAAAIASAWWTSASGTAGIGGARGAAVAELSEIGAAGAGDGAGAVFRDGVIFGAGVEGCTGFGITAGAGRAGAARPTARGGIGEIRGDIGRCAGNGRLSAVAVAALGAGDAFAAGAGGDAGAGVTFFLLNGNSSGNKPAITAVSARPPTDLSATRAGAADFS